MQSFCGSDTGCHQQDPEVTLPCQPKFLVQHCHLSPEVPDLKEVGILQGGLSCKMVPDLKAYAAPH